MPLTLIQSKTAADYARLKEGTPIQLIGGEFVMSPSPTTAHQRISGYLFWKMYDFVATGHLGEVLHAPMDLHVSRNDIYQPDLLYVSNAHEDWITEDGVHGPPDLVIEILSPSTAGFDLLTKKDTYEAFGVREYWIVDPVDRTIEVFVVTPHGYEARFMGKAGTLRSTVLPEFSLEVGEVFGR